MTSLKDELNELTAHYEKNIEYWIVDYQAGLITAREFANCIIDECDRWDKERIQTIKEF